MAVAMLPVSIDTSALTSFSHTHYKICVCVCDCNSSSWFMAVIIGEEL